MATVLMQDDKPVACHSQVLELIAHQKPAYEELVAIVFAVLKWRSYLLGRKFFVEQIRGALNFYLNNTKLVWNTKSEFVIFWVLTLKFATRLAKLNRAADALLHRLYFAELPC